MPLLREQDFEKMATRVVDRFLAGQAKLADAAAEEASTASLNPDQIQRLVQAANTMTFLRMMDQRKQEGAGDLMHEFDPIDSSQVMQQLIHGAGSQMLPQQPSPDMPGMDGAMDGMSGHEELPDEMGQMRNAPEGAPGHFDSPQVEDCEEQCHDEHDPPGMMTPKNGPPGMAAEEEEEDSNDGPFPMGSKDKKPKKAPSKKDDKPGKAEKKDKPEKEGPPKEAQLQVMRARKLAGILEDQMLQAEHVFEETFDKLAERFKRIYGPSYDAFEKDALAEHGNEVGLIVINMLRERQKRAELSMSTLHEKVAALQDRHISEDTPELFLFEKLVKIGTEAQKLTKALAYVKAQCA